MSFFLFIFAIKINKMIKGIVYKYTSPDGTVYIGQTINECHRRGLFFLAKHYGGVKIDNARKKFGPENFYYERLHIKEYTTLKEAKLDLDKIEAYYIGYYDSVNNGYNSVRGFNLPSKSVSKKKLYKDCSLPPIKNNNIRIGLKNTFKPVAQYDLQGNLLAEYESIGEASRNTGIHISNISRNCQGKLFRVRNFIFKYI